MGGKAILALALHTAAVIVLLLPTLAVSFPGRVAIATVLRSPSDVLPARVMLRSAAHHSPAVPRVAYALPGSLSPSDRALVLSDGVDVRSFHPALNPTERALSYTRFFGETRFERILYIAPQMLVKDDLARLLDCPVFCAAFVSPCSFSTGVLVFTPQREMYGQILRRLKSVEGCEGKDVPDGLSKEACELNELFGKDLMNAPLFDMKDGGPSSNDNSVGTAVRRLPMGCQTPHILFYPRLRFEVPRESCGALRIIDFRSPSFLQPWAWWTYALMNLSWDWLGYRLQLGNPNTPLAPSLAGLLFRVLVLHAASALVVVSSFPRKRAGRHGSQKASIVVKYFGVCPEHAFLPAASAISLLLWLLSLCFAFSRTPRTLLPQHAFALFVTYKNISLSLVLVMHGRLFCATQALPSDVVEDPPPSTFRVCLETFAFAVADVVTISVLVFLINEAPVGTIYLRVLCFIPAILVHWFFLLVGFVRVSMRWLAWGAGREDLGTSPGPSTLPSTRPRLLSRAGRTRNDGLDTSHTD